MAEPIKEALETAAESEAEVDVTQLTDAELAQKLGPGTAESAVETGATSVASSAATTAALSVAVVPLTPEEITKLRKQVLDKEAFIQRQARELGDLRKKVKPETEEETAARIEEQKRRFDEDPHAATADVIADLETRRTTRRESIRAMIPNLEDIKGDIAALVREEGIESEANIEVFLNDPYTADPSKLRYWALEVLREKEKTALEKRIAVLEGKVQDGTKGIVKKIEAAAAAPKTLTAHTGKEPDADGDDTKLTEEQISYLSDEKLKELTQKTRRKK